VNAAAAPVSSRTKVIDAAERLVSRMGASGLTLDAVAQEAGISKGGLLYHFRSKEALIQGMIERHIACVEELVDERRARAGEPLTLQIYVGALLEAGGARRNIGAALLAASASDPALLMSCRQHYAKKLENFIRTPADLERVGVVLLAMDGLLLNELMQVSPYTDTQRQRIVAALLRMAGDCATPPPTN
jgi:AcrR family transcriptional regulator